MTTPKFDSPEAYEQAVVATGVDASTCALVATHQLVGFMLGIDIRSEDAIRQEYGRKGNNLGSVEVINPEDTFKCQAKLGCKACGQEIMLHGPIDAQGVGTLSDTEPLCPVLQQAPDRATLPKY